MTVESSRDGASREPLAAFAELSKIMLGDGSLNETLGRIAALARETVPDTDEVSVTLVDHDKAKTVVFTGQLAMHLDERQYENGRGPCLDAALTGETVVVDVFADDSLYPDFAYSARRAGVTHTVSVGLPVPQRVVGAQPLRFHITALVRGDHQPRPSLRQLCRCGSCQCGPLQPHRRTCESDAGSNEIPSCHRASQRHPDGPAPLQRRRRLQVPVQTVPEKQPQTPRDRPINRLR